MADASGYYIFPYVTCLFFVYFDAVRGPGVLEPPAPPGLRLCGHVPRRHRRDFASAGQVIFGQKVSDLPLKEVFLKGN